MRKAQKQEVENFLKLLQQAHNMIRKLLENKEEAVRLAVCGILEDCQQGAIETGEMIGQSEGEKFITVHMLEEYCEYIYQIYEWILSGKTISADQVHKNLDQLLARIKNSVRQDITVRKEVVFLPYKASMWDSLESIWKAADKAPDCDAYVIPIPYYDKNPDGSFRNMHYEGGQYPDYVPVTNYPDYNFTQRRPDVVFIHNPYDNNNYVTSVEPFYYSKNLKQYTEKLVYIPYFILEEVHPDNQAAVDEIKSFCIASGVINADKVIVQSENMRQIYIHILTEFMGEHTRKIWENKILGYGSPKVDKIRRTRKEDLDIPGEWNRLIRKPDESSKKVVFYNTGLGALLQHNEQMLAKIRDVLNIFESRKNEIVLLWRPHPLIKSTITSMRPGLWEQYEKIVAEYRSKGFGIYDDSVDMNRAVVLSDAYYGDRSSVVQLVLKTGRPAMIQNVEVFLDSKNELLFGEGFSIIDGTVCMPLAMLNTFGMFHIQTGDTVYPCGFGDVYQQEGIRTYLYTDCIQTGTKIIFSPTRADCISVYDKAADKVEKIQADIPPGFKKFIPNYSFIIKSPSGAFLIGVMQTNLIVEWNQESGTLNYYGTIVNENPKMQNRPVYGKNAVFMDDRLYIPLLVEGMVYELDYQTKEEKLLHIDSQNRGLFAIFYNKNRLYIITDDGGLLVCSKEKVREVNMPDNRKYVTGIIKNDFLWLFSAAEWDTAIKIDLNKDFINEELLHEDLHEEKNKELSIEMKYETIAMPYAVRSVRDMDERRILLHVMGGFVLLDVGSGRTEWISFTCKEFQDQKELVKKWGVPQNPCVLRYEGNVVYDTLDVFLDELTE